MKAWCGAAMIGLVFAASAYAEAPATSVRPFARPAAVVAVTPPAAVKLSGPSPSVVVLPVPNQTTAAQTQADFAPQSRQMRQTVSPLALSLPVLADPFPAPQSAPQSAPKSGPHAAPEVVATVRGDLTRPRSRPAAVAVTASVPAVVRGLGIRPRARPANFVAMRPAVVVPQPVERKAEAEVAHEVGGAASAVPHSLRPAKRPKNLDKIQLASASAVRVTPGKQVALGKKGSVCGDPAIRGEVLSPIGARVNGCGIPEPVRITNVAGVRLSQAATVDCPTALALKRWIKDGLEPAYGEGKVVQLQIAGHYVCRTRNHRPGAKISEHGRGKAIDISGFTFSNGKTVPVLRNFNATMRKAHKAACGIFGTTLGPGSDGMHEDHLHFDTARHRNGSYCR